MTKPKITKSAKVAKAPAKAAKAAKAAKVAKVAKATKAPAPKAKRVTTKRIKMFRADGPTVQMGYRDPELLKRAYDLTDQKGLEECRDRNDRLILLFWGTFALNAGRAAHALPSKPWYWAHKLASVIGCGSLVAYWMGYGLDESKLVADTLRSQSMGTLTASWPGRDGGIFGFQSFVSLRTTKGTPCILTGQGLFTEEGVRLFSGRELIDLAEQIGFANLDRIGNWALFFSEDVEQRAKDALQSKEMERYLHDVMDTVGVTLREDADASAQPNSPFNAINGIIQ